MRKVSIFPVTYRQGQGVYLQIAEYKGSLPITAVWQITNDPGYVLETGTYTFLQAEWDNWPSGDDNYYPERIVANSLGLNVLQ